MRHDQVWLGSGNKSAAWQEIKQLNKENPINFHGSVWSSHKQEHHGGLSVCVIALRGQSCQVQTVGGRGI